MAKHTHYTYRVTWSQEDGEFVAQCLEFPSLSLLAETQAQALRGMVSLVEEVVLDMEKNGEIIPVALASQNYSGKFMLRIPPEQHRKLAMKAAEEQVSLNRYISSKLL